MSNGIPNTPQSVLCFDGVDDRVIFSKPLDQIKDAISIEFWAKGTSDLTASTSIMEAHNEQNARVLNIHFPWNNNIYWDAGNNGSNFDRIDKAVQAKEYQNTWTHWTFTKDSSTGEMHIYRNGEIWHSGSGKSHSLTGITLLIIGCYEGDRYHWGGLLAEFRIWGVALTPEQIQARMHQRLKGDESGLVAYWMLNEGEGNTVTDKTGNGNNGTISGATWETEEIPLQPQTTPTESEADTAPTLVKQGPEGGSVEATPFEIQPETNLREVRLKAIRLVAAWAIANIEVEYKNLATNPPEGDRVSASGEGISGDSEQFVIEEEDYLVKVSGTWGRQAPGYPKEEIISLQFHTHKGIDSAIFGGMSGTQEVESFSFEAPENHAIIGFWGTRGGRQNLLISLGIYLKRLSTTQPSNRKMANQDTGLADYGYWHKWKQSLPQPTEKKPFRRGRIWS